MTIYIVLIIAILFYGILHPSYCDDKNRLKTVVFSFLLIFLVMALRSYTVGRDIPGYMNAYKNAAFHDWGDYDYIYFEEGYVFFMKLCNAIGMSFQTYLAVVAGIILLPIAFFIYKYSDDPVISILLYICFVRFEFDLTGIRQAMSISLCTVALMAFLKKEKGSFWWFVVICAMAISIHLGAIVFLCLPIISRIKKPTRMFFITIILLIIAIVSRNTIFNYLGSWFSTSTNLMRESSAYFGIFNLLSCILIVCFLVMNSRNVNTHSTVEINTTESACAVYQRNDVNVCFLNMYICSIALSIFFGTNTTARSFMYYNFPVLVIVPNYMNKVFDQKRRLICKACIVIFFVAYFIYNVLNNNNFDIYPYHFFWNVD